MTSRPNVARILKYVHSGWFCLVSFKCDGVLSASVSSDLKALYKSVILILIIITKLESVS